MQTVTSMSKHPNFRQELEEAKVIDELILAVTALQAEPNPPKDPLAYILEKIGATEASSEADQVIRENKELKEKLTALQQQLADLEARLLSA